MNENRKRMKIKICILCSIVTLFVITGIIYIFTISAYLREPTDNTLNTLQKETTETEETVIEIPATDVTTETVSPTEKIPEKVLSFKDTCTKKYVDEMTQTNLSYLSDTTYIAVFQKDINGNPYTLAHVIIKSPNQITNVISDTKRLSTELYEMDQALLAISSSMMDSHISFIDGMHITNSEIISVSQMATGTELACDISGKLCKLQPGATPDETVFTVLTTAPLLIENKTPATIPDTLMTSKTCKSAIGMVVPCEYYFITASDGNYINEITYEDMQNILLEQNCTFAQALTTNINVAMSFTGQLVNKPAAQSGRAQYEYLIIKD